MPLIPWSHPGITIPAPSLNLNGSRPHEVSNSSPVENVMPPYCIVSELPSFATEPLPFTMSRLTSLAGGSPFGLAIGGFFPSFSSPGVGGSGFDGPDGFGSGAVELDAAGALESGISAVLSPPLPQPATAMAPATTT